MSLIENLIVRLKRHPKRVVFPAGCDPRILQAARQFATRELGIPILIGNRLKIKTNAEKLNINLGHIRIVDPARSSERDNLAQHLRTIPRFAELNDQEVDTLLEDHNYFATLMLATSQADAMVSGASSTTSSALRPLLHIIPFLPKVSTMSSLNIFDLEDPTGRDRELFLADCAVIPEPTSEQLCDIAVTTAALRYHLTNKKPHVALLSFSNKSPESKNPTVAKVKAATAMAHEKAKALGIPMEIDGELQVDVAIDPITAKLKGVQSPVAGRSNVLIFPDLNSANIAAKLIDSLIRARDYGPILTGLSRPAAEISQGANTNDIFGTAVMVASQAINHKLLYPTDNCDELNEDVTIL